MSLVCHHAHVHLMFCMTVSHPIVLCSPSQGLQVTDLLDPSGKNLNPKLGMKQVLMEEAK